MTKHLFISAVFASVLGLPVLAQDVCKDILADGTMKQINLESSKYAKLAFMHRLYRMTDDQLKEELRHVGSFNLYGFMPMDSDNVDQTIDSFREVFEKEFNLNMTRDEEIKLMALSGDPHIVRAWSDCMRRDGNKGVHVYFTKVEEGAENSLVANLSVQFRPPQGATNMTPKITTIDPDDLGFLSTKPDISVDSHLVRDAVISSFVTFPNVTTEDDGKLRTSINAV